jgi:predicted O-linked N-acetylglucosamine transferase (SPINDLY family)
MIDDYTAQAEASFQRGFALHQQGRLDDARVFYEQALRLVPTQFNALHMLGLLCSQANHPQLAVDLIAHAIRVNPHHAPAHHSHANALFQLRDYAPAIEGYDRAIAIDARYIDAHNNRGVALYNLKRFEEAVASYDRALALDAKLAHIHNNRGNAMRELALPEAAVESYDKAIALDPKNGAAYYNRGIALADLKRFEAAVASYESAIGLMPQQAEVYTNLGTALREMRRFDAALASYDKAVALDANYADAYNQGGIALFMLRRFSAAVASYDRAIALNPGNADFYYNRALALQEPGQQQAAIANYASALALKPDFKYVPGLQLMARMQICDWDGIGAQIAQLAESINHNQPATAPFAVLAFSGSAALQRRAAEIWTREEFPATPSLPSIAKHPRRQKIRIGYFSSDFREHATSYLMAEVFERHDKSRFEVTAFSFGPQSRDAMRTRLEAAFDDFLDVRAKSDEEIALLARDRQIDIAIDLNGYTQDGRPAIFAVRAAPLQVLYLGYPGTLGASYMEYLIADKTLIPEASRQFYREKIIYLPNSYQANDSKRRISEKVFDRAELGLPASGLVFCCFNNAFKIAPQTFDDWMQILKRVDGSVLWLLADNPTAVSNLRDEAARRDVSAERLVFAAHLPQPEHLARYRAADLFLDTLPCNAHTTASDALWAGLPVLTCAGESFASRVAASLLRAVDLPELIASTRSEYQEMAVALAADPRRLAALKQKLAANKGSAPLFDTALTTRHLEAAYENIYARYQNGLPSDHIE